MRQDLITPYNVLFCGCLAYTPVPVRCLEEHSEHTIDPLLLPPPPSSSTSLPFLHFQLLRPPSPPSSSSFTSLSLSVSSLSSFSYSNVKVWVVCVYAPASLPPLAFVPRRSSHPSAPCPPPLPSGACVLLYALPYLLQGKGIRELILI